MRRDGLDAAGARRISDEIGAHGVWVAWLGHLPCRRTRLYAVRTAVVVAAARTHDFDRRLLPPYLLAEPAPLTSSERSLIRLRAPPREPATGPGRWSGQRGADVADAPSTRRIVFSNP